MQTDKYYFFYKHQFGQWTLRDMVDEGGIVYNCCEQYMMAHKARLFGDDASVEKIMAEKNPRKQQELGRLVEEYDEAIWIPERGGIVHRGNTLKFTQHPDLKQRLVDTFPLVLVEASKIDRIWGVGLAETDPLILDSKNWRGLNLLGYMITQVRDEIIAGKI